MPGWINRITGLILAILIFCSPELLRAAGQSSSDAAQSPATATASLTDSSAEAATAPQADAGQTSAPANRNETERALPDAPSSAASTQDNKTQTQQPAEPAGAAAAQIGKLKGGPASKPAGSAIAPARQRRVRSFLIKFGAIAGAGAALGMVYALSRSSPSRPPGAR